MDNYNKNIGTNYAIVGSQTGKLLFKKENDQLFFLNSQNSKVIQNERRFDHLIKWIYDLKTQLGEITIDVKNSFEELKVTTEEREIINKKNFNMVGNNNIIEVNGEKLSSVMKIDKVKSLVINNLFVEGIKSISGNVEVKIQFSQDNSKWSTYDSFNLYNTSGKSLENKDIPTDFTFGSTKKIEFETTYVYLRLKLSGRGSIGYKNSKIFSITANGEYITNEIYEDVIDEQTDIYIKSSTESNLKCDRNLLHINGFYATNKFQKRNQKQTVSINLNSNSGSKKTIIKETYTENFIGSIAVNTHTEEGYFLFENNDITKPTIVVPSQIKQLLSEKSDGTFVNKRNISINSDFSKFGYEIESGITHYNYKSEKQSNVISEQLGKIKFRLKESHKFSEILAEEYITSEIADADNRKIFTGNIKLSNETNVDKAEIIKLIKTKKTFYKMSAILYTDYNEDIDNLVKALSAGVETPQTVFLVCTNPNDSTIEKCVFDKIELGKKTFYENIISAIKDKIGIQFNTLEEVFSHTSNFINQSIELEEKISITNAVAFNFYVFTGATIDENYMDKYGYYVNKAITNYANDLSFTALGTSKTNTIEGVVQYDIGTPINLEFDLSSNMQSLNIEQFTETNDNGLSLSITHNDNIFYKYVVGMEEIIVFDNEKNKPKYTVSINDQTIKLKTNENLTINDRGDNNVTLLIKDKNGITTSYIVDFIVDFPEPVVNEFYIKPVNKINEVGYSGKTDIEYTKDNFLEVGLNLTSNYEFNEGEYKILIEHSTDPEYKIEKNIKGKLASKIFSFHIDDIKNQKEIIKKIKFGEWICKLVRIKRNHVSSKTTCNINNDILNSISFNALPVAPDYEDFENNGLQQGKDVYIKLSFSKSEYFKKIRDFIYFCKEVRFIVNNVNFTKEKENFTYLNTNSLESVTKHITEKLDERNEMRWLISGSSEGASNEYLKPISNLEGNEKKSKTIKLQFVTFTDELFETDIVKIGENGKVKGPIILGSDEHKDKLLSIAGKEHSTTPDKLSKEQLEEVEKKLKELGKFNYSNQQIINDIKTFVFYSDLAEIQFDFGICEYYSVSQANNTTELIPVTKDGKIRYVLNKNGIDENSKAILTVKGYVKLADGKIISSEEVTIVIYRKKTPSLISTGDDYTRYVLYQQDEHNYYKLQTLIQSKISLENLDGMYSEKWMSHIEVEMVDIDKRTIIVSGPPVRFYDGFIPQRFVFDSGITDETLNGLDEDDRLGIEQAVNYVEVEKILNEKIFSKNKHLGQTFYLRMRGVETAIDCYGKKIKIYGKESFYPISFDEALKELLITPANGIVVVKNNDIENYYTYKNKVNFILESNNAEYFMYRTDRSAAFQKVYPKTIGYSKIVKLVVSTYEIGNHILEVKQKAVGETESNVYSVIVEKLNSPKAPKIVGEKVVDLNPKWTLYPVESAEKYMTSVITDEVEHSKQLIDSLQYEIEISPDKYLENGYHIFTASSVDKIGNTSETSFFVTRKIGRPVASEIIGTDKTSEEFIKWEWKSQYNEGVREYEVEINGIEKNIIPASTNGFNNFYLRYFQGKKIEDGTYEIRVWAINEIKNKSYIYSSFLTHKGTKIGKIAIEFYKYKDDYTNKLYAKVLTNDKGLKHIEYEIFENKENELISVSGVMKSSQKELPFIKSDGTKLELKDGNYYFAFRGVNFIDEKTEYVKIPFIYKTSLPEKPFIYYQKSVKSSNPVFFAKEKGNEMIEAIEIKIGEHNFEKIRNNVWRPNYSIPQGVNNVVFRITDFAGNTAEYGDFIEVTPNGVNMFQEDYMADMNNPVVKLDFNLQQMNNFGHTNFRIHQENLGIDAIVNIKNANNIEIPLTANGEEIFPDGIYIFSIKLYDELTQGYDYIVDYFTVTIDSNKPNKPYFLNNGYSKTEFNRSYTKNKNPKWIWQIKNITNLKEYRIDLHVFDKTENNYIEYGNGQFIDFSTGLVGQFQSPDEFKDGTYKLSVRSIGKNNLSSENEVFIFVIKNSLPKPPHFDTTKMINRKYENKNRGISWIWEDLNDGDDKLVAYKIKLNDEDFSDEIKERFYEEKRILKDGENKITVIGRDKAGNWSSSNEINANQLGSNYLTHTKIIDTKVPENMRDEDIKIKIIDSKSFEAFFQNDTKTEEYFIFELFTLDIDENEVLFVKGNTLPKGTKDIFFREEEVVPGVNVGSLEDNGYCEIRNNTTVENKLDNSLYFTNLPNNVYYLRVYGVDYAGNISQPLMKVIEIQDLTKLKPLFILPSELYTNNSTIIFQWILNESNIKNWEYQLVTPYNNSSVDLASETKWKQLKDNIFTLNNIPKLIGGINADGDYTLYVRAVFDEIIQQEGTQLEVFKKSDVNSITVRLDRQIPKGILFTNKSYTADPSVLRWTWEYTGEGDNADGVFVSFNPSLPLEQWTKLENATEYSSFKERNDGVYTLYVKTYDRAGNINDSIFSNAITLDRVPPFKPIINGGTHIFVNRIPTIQWEMDNNYYKFAWLVLPLETFNQFKNIYDQLVNVQSYTITNNDWAYIFSKNSSDFSKEEVNSEIKTIDFEKYKNDFINENQITINSSAIKNGISEEGEYVFVLSGFDQNGNWAEEFEYQFITYDITAPNLDLIKFISPQYTITNERRPKWEWTTPNDVIKCEYSLEKNGYDDGSVAGTITRKINGFETYNTYSFTPEFNLTKGNYRLIVNCYDASGNYVEITKNVIIEDSSSELETEFFDIILEGKNNIIRCKMNKYSSVYVIIDTTIDKNSVLTYRNSKNKTDGFKIYELNKTELSLYEEYDFNITSYDVIIK